MLCFVLKNSLLCWIVLELKSRYFQYPKQIWEKMPNFLRNNGINRGTPVITNNSCINYNLIWWDLNGHKCLETKWEKRGVDQLDWDLIKDKFEWHSGLISFTRSLPIKGISDGMIYSNIFHLLASKSTQTNFYIVRLFTRRNEGQLSVWFRKISTWTCVRICDYLGMFNSLLFLDLF